VNPAYIDFETQSSHELKGSTAQKYAKDPSTKVLTCVVKVGDAIHRMGPYLTPEHRETLQRIAEQHTLVAHNAAFDAAIWEHTLKLPEATWCDTLPMAHAAGLPGGLDKLGMALTGEGKDKNGARLIDMLCKVGRLGVPAVGPAHAMLMEYNVRDVVLLEQIHSHVAGYGIADVMTVDRIINQRGIPVNREFAVKLKALFAENRRRSADAFDEYENDGEKVNPRSSKQVQEWMETLGFKLDGVNKATLKQFNDSPETFFTGEGSLGEMLKVAQEALMHRKELVGIGVGKLDAVLGYERKGARYEGVLEADDRIRDAFVVYGAGPGRWAGRGLQPHNLPSVLARETDIRGVELEYEAVVAAAKHASEKAKRHIAPSEILNGMIRHIVQGDLLIADYAQIEARCLAWIADSKKMLATFADVKQSLYIDLSEKIFGRRVSKKDEADKYNLCKALILGCGYGMSGAKFEFTNRARGEFDMLQAMYDAGYTADEAVKFYRSTYPEVPALWKTVGDAVINAVHGVSSEVAKCKFYVKQNSLHIELPSGRPIVYRNSRIADMVPAYCKMYNMPEKAIPTFVYDHPRGYTGFLYGSKAVENICQGICADFLGMALVRHEQLGLDPVFHVHDEGGCQKGPKHFREFMIAMSECPAWAPDFPLLAEGTTATMWSKNTGGWAKMDAMCGRIL